MLNILANERLKLKRNKLIPMCTLIAIMLPIAMIIADVSAKNATASTFTIIEWVNRLVLPIQVIVYPVLSGFVITFLIQKEYVERTMINTLTAPTNRIKLVLGKYIIWSLWVVVLTLLILLITYGGVYLLFGKTQFLENFYEITELCLKTGILNLLSMSPILIICILQRQIFYPSLLFSCLVSGIGFVGLYWSETIRNVIPWSAVTSITFLNSDVLLPYVSVICCYICGLAFSFYSFNRQNL